MRERRIRKRKKSEMAKGHMSRRVKGPEKGSEKWSGKPELLAPAGNLEGFFSALSAGADAVYVGLPRFNARMRADNFSIPDLAKLIPHARSLGKKVYIALNTQVLEEELPSFIDLVARANLLEPDAFIVGDLGALEILKRSFPRAEVHASTMMGNFNARILDVFGRLGVKRAILERHLDLDQVKEAVRRSPIDVEVFVHGAMCFSYSGRCLFSSYLGGKSGNRGECVQPCRRVFHDEKTGRDGAYFSTKDLSLIHLIPDLVKLGVRAFKVEGRMRGADYIFGVLSAYRRALDATWDGKAEEGIAEGEAMLEKVIGRERTSGVLAGEAYSSIVSEEASGAVGEFVGNVEKRRGPYVLLTGGGVLKKGERLRVQDRFTGKGTGFTLLSIRRSVSETWVKVPFDVRPGDLVFRVSPRRDRRRVTDSAGSLFAGLPPSGIRFAAAFRGRVITISGSIGGFKKRYTFRVEGGKDETALVPEKLHNVLLDAYEGDFPIAGVSIRGDMSPGITPDDILSAFEKASKNFDKSLHLDLKQKRVDIISTLKVRGGRRERKPTGLYACVGAPDDASSVIDKADYVIIALSKSLARKPRKLMSFSRDKIIIGLPLAQSDNLLTFYRSGIKKIAAMGFKKFVIPDIGWIKVFKEAGIAGRVEVISDHSIYAFNTAACIALQKMGVERFILPLESTLDNLVKEAKFLKGLGILPVFVNVPLLVSRLSSFGGDGERWVRSRMGERFKILADPGGTVIFSEKSYSASGHIDRFMKLGITDFLVDLRNVDSSERAAILENVRRDREIPDTSTYNLFRENF